MSYASHLPPLFLLHEFAYSPPLRLAAVADALSGMFDIDFLILLLLSGMAVVVQRDMQEPRSTPRGVGQK
jgi:hypothetical protein